MGEFIDSFSDPKTGKCVIQLDDIRHELRRPRVWCKLAPEFNVYFLLYWTDYPETHYV